MASRVRDDVEAPGAGLDAYTGILIVSLVATIIGLVFLFLDYSSYKAEAPKLRQIQAMNPAPQQQAPTGAAAPAQPKPQ
jgi:hypothetical protein